MFTTSGAFLHAPIPYLINIDISIRVHISIFYIGTYDTYDTYRRLVGDCMEKYEVKYLKKIQMPKF